MKDDDDLDGRLDGKLSADELALLGALAAGDDVSEARGLREVSALDEAMAAELASHRALVSELRALPEPAPSPNWRQLEASIRQACDEVPVKRSWWQALRDAWRVPTLGLGAAAMASLALLLWTRAPKPMEQPLDAAPRELPTRSQPQAEKIAEATAPVIAERTATGAMFLDDEVVDDIDERGVDELMKQLPDDAAFALGASDENADDEDELLPGGAYDDEIEQLDDEALRALDQWLDAEQKG